MRYVGNAEPHYGLRKLSIGVASVLLGMTVTGIVGHADAGTPVNNSKNVSVDESVSDSNLNESNQVVLQSKQTGGDNPANIQNIEGGDSENVEGNSVGSDNQHASAMPQNMYVQSAVENNNISNSVQNSQLVTKVYQAQDVNVSLFHDSGYDDSAMSIRTGIEDFIGCNTDFQVDLTGAKIGDQVTIGNVNQLTSSGRFMKVRSGATQLVTYQGKTIGQLMVDTSGKYSSRLYMQLTDIPRDSGVVHIHTHSDSLLVVWANAFDFHGLSGSSLNTFSFVNSDGSKSSLSYSVIKSNLTYADEHKDFYDDLFGSKAWLSTAQFSSEKGHIIFYTSSPEFSQQLLQQAILSNNVSSPLPLLTQNFEYGIKLSNSDGLLPNIDSADSTMFFKYPVVVNGRYVDQSRSGFTVTGLSYNLSLKNIRMADGLSFQQLKALLDPAKSELLYSVQDSKTILLAFNINAKDFETKEDLAAIKRDLLGMSAAVNASDDPDASAGESAKAILNVLQGYPLKTEMWTAFHWADPTAKSVVNTQLVDLDTGKVISQSSDTYNPPSSQVEGQSTVKLHFVNGNTGTDLAQVKAYTDWPNQGKHAQLSIPTITGYHLETNAPQDILSKFNLSGTALTTNSAVDYPAEDTISDYYFVMTPNDETATVNIIDADEGDKVLSTGTITGKFGQVVSLSSDLQSKLDALMATGHYVESANDLDGEVTYGDGASKVYTIKLKHKLDSVQRHYRVIEDLPDGSQKVIIDMKAVLYKDADADSYYWNGAVLNGKLDDKDWNESLVDKKLLKQNEYQDITGTRVWASDPSWLQAKVDSFAGYKRVLESDSQWHGGVSCSWNKDQQFVLLDMFNGYIYPIADPLASQDFHIKYLKNQYPVIVSYYDQSGHQIATSTKSYDYLTQLDLTANTPANYVLLTGQNTKLTVGYDHNELDLLVAPKITQRQEQKIIRRIIEITDPKGLEHNVEQDVVFVRNVYHDNAANSDTEGSWRALGRDHFVAYVPVVVDGYTAQSAGDQVALPTDQDQIVKLSYTPLVTPSVPKYIDSKGNGYSELPVGYAIVNGQNSENGSMLIIKKPAPIVTNKIEYVTRTITIYMPNGHKRTITQKARKGSKFVQAHLPKLRGYQVQIDGNIGSVDANGNLTATVKFVKI